MFHFFDLEACYSFDLGSVFRSFGLGPASLSMLVQQVGAYAEKLSAKEETEGTRNEHIWCGGLLCELFCLIHFFQFISSRWWLRLSHSGRLSIRPLVDLCFFRPWVICLDRWRRSLNGRNAPLLDEKVVGECNRRACTMET